MKASKFTEAQIAFVLKQADEGTAVAEVCRKAGISEATFYVWRKKYGNLLQTEIKRLRQLEDENAKLKRIVTELSLDKAMLQDVLKKSFKACSASIAPRRSPSANRHQSRTQIIQKYPTPSRPQNAATSARNHVGKIPNHWHINMVSRQPATGR